MISERPNNYSAKALAEKSLLYGITHEPPRGRKVFFYLLVDPIKEKAFLKAMESSDSLNLLYYGTIVAAGYGEPPQELIDKLEERYKTRLAPVEEDAA